MRNSASAPRVVRLALAALALSAAVLAQDSFAGVKQRVTTFKLANGMKFIILERHQAPVASFYTYADVGAVDDDKGQTGMAHMFEHMAFKGTPKIGTKNYAEEKNALDRVDQAFLALRAERDKGARADKAKLKQLEADLNAAQEGAGKFVESNEFTKIIEQAGGKNLNASTGTDKTDYFFSLPSNSAELWFYLESERFLHPVMREFYKEAGVVREERRMRTDSSPLGRMIEEFLATAYVGHPYGVPGIGHMSDLENFTRKDAEAFFKKYYSPSNLTCAIVGDVDPKKMAQFAQTYFGRIPSGPKPDPIRTVEPPQRAERRLVMRAQAQRVVLVGYHKPAATDPDGPIYDVMGSLLSEGRSSRLYRSLITNKKLAVGAGGFPDFPGEKYPGLFLFYGFTAQGKTNEELEKEILAEIERLKTEPATQEELDGVKRRFRSGLLGQMNNNTSMAMQLAKFDVMMGSWEHLFRYLDEINKVTAADLQRIAKKIFVPNNRTVAYMEPDQKASN